jgi:hypothetical protein
MCDELERIWKEAVVAQPRYYPIIRLDGLRITTEKFKQSNSRLRVKSVTAVLTPSVYTPTGKELRVYNNSGGSGSSSGFKFFSVIILNSKV